MQTTMVSARALWPKTVDVSWPAPMFYCTIDGAGYISDRSTLMPVARLAALPVGWGNLMMPLPPQAEDGFAMWLASTVLPGPSDRLFARAIVDPLEAAGFLLRPLDGVRNAHGICDPTGELVGLAMPMHAAVVGDSTEPRKAAI